MSVSFTTTPDTRFLRARVCAPCREAHAACDLALEQPCARCTRLGIPYDCRPAPAKRKTRAPAPAAAAAPVEEEAKRLPIAYADSTSGRKKLRKYTIRCPQTVIALHESNADASTLANLSRSVALLTDEMRALRHEVSVLREDNARLAARQDSHESACLQLQPYNHYRHGPLATTSTSSSSLSSSSSFVFGGSRGCSPSSLWWTQQVVGVSSEASTPQLGSFQLPSTMKTTTTTMSTSTAPHSCSLDTTFDEELSVLQSSLAPRTAWTNLCASLPAMRPYASTFSDLVSDSLPTCVLVEAANPIVFEPMVAYVNHAFLLLSGYSREEMEGHPFSEFFTVIGRNRTMLASLMFNPTPFSVSPIMHASPLMRLRDGRTLRLRDQSRFCYDADGKALFVVGLMYGWHEDVCGSDESFTWLPLLPVATSTAPPSGPRFEEEKDEKEEEGEACGSKSWVYPK